MTRTTTAMQDQANELRHLVRQAARSSPREPGAAPKLVAVAGSKGGVGATTIAVNLAVALACEGRRTVLVDANLASPDAASLLQVDDVYHVGDVLGGRCTVHEALQRGPAGIQVLSGPWGQNQPSDFSPRSQDRLIEQLIGLGGHADFVILDIGSGQGPTPRRFWEAADHVLLVTSPEVVSIMDAYAAVKMMDAGHAAGTVQVLVNSATDAATAADAYQRLTRACRRFLGLSIASAGHVLSDHHITAAGAQRRSFVLEFPGREASQCVKNLAKDLPALTDGSRPPRRLSNLPGTARAPCSPAESAAAASKQCGLDPRKPSL